MARAGVNFVHVSKAAEALTSRGLTPTVERIRLELGTGSSSTLAPLLKQWKSLHGESANNNGLPNDLIEAVKSLHERIQSAADAKIDSVETEQNRLVVTLRQSLEDANNTITSLKNQLQSSELQLNSITTQHQATLKELDAIRVSETVYRTQCESNQEQLIELKANREELKHDNRAMREQAEHYQQHIALDRQQEREQFRFTVQQLQTQLDQSLQQYKKLEHKYLELDMQKKSADATLEQYRVQQLTEQQDSAALRSELSSLKASQQEIQAQMNTLKTKESERSATNTQLQVQLAIIQNDYRALKTMSDHQEARLAETLERLTILTDTNSILLQEKAMAEGQLKQLQRALPAR